MLSIDRNVFCETIIRRLCLLPSIPYGVFLGYLLERVRNLQTSW